MLSHDVDLADLKPKLLEWLQEKMPQARDLCISDMERSGAGFTNVSIPFTLSWQEAGQSRTEGMLFRGAGTSDPVYPDPKVEKQFRVMRCLQDTDVPVPQVFWLEKDQSLFGYPFYIMSKIEGIVPSEFPPYHSFGICYDANPEQRAKMWRETLEAMARIHRLDWESLGLSFLGVPGSGTDPLDRELAYYAHYLNWVKEDPQPVLEASLEWLKQNRYAPERVTLCWGDARLPNAVFSPNGDLRAVLDWDMAILGDPESDLTFMLALDWFLSEGTDVPRLEGFPDQRETIAYYQELTGWRVQHLFYNEVFATLRAGIIILSVQKNLLKMGVDLPGEDPLLDNPCTRRLAGLLDLPAPGRSGKQITRNEEVSGTVQVHLTGPGGGDWYIVAEKGQVTRHEGRAPEPDATLIVPAEDWAAIQRGDLNPFNAWTTGKIQVEGNDTLYRQLADRIARFWK
jgi:aminoglycoside phosphotransferase (APT) family kinase protein/putative sterol carrier protein